MGYAKEHRRFSGMLSEFSSDESYDLDKLFEEWKSKKWDPPFPKDLSLF